MGETVTIPKPVFDNLMFYKNQIEQLIEQVERLEDGEIDVFNFSDEVLNIL